MHLIVSNRTVVLAMLQATQQLISVLIICQHSQ